MMRFSTLRTILATLALSSQVYGDESDKFNDPKLPERKEYDGRRCDIVQNGTNITMYTDWGTHPVIKKSLIHGPLNSTFVLLTDLDFGLNVSWPYGAQFANFSYDNFELDRSAPPACSVTDNMKFCSIACETSPLINGTLIHNVTDVVAKGGPTDVLGLSNQPRSVQQ